jgi:hypothetical protein
MSNPKIEAARVSIAQRAPHTSTNGKPPTNAELQARVRTLEAEAIDREAFIAQFMAVADTWASTLYRMTAMEAFEAVKLQRTQG